MMGHVGVQRSWVAEAFDGPFAIQPESDFAFSYAMLLAYQFHHCEHSCNAADFAPVSALFE